MGQGHFGAFRGIHSQAPQST